MSFKKREVGKRTSTTRNKKARKIYGKNIKKKNTSRFIQSLRKWIIYSLIIFFIITCFFLVVLYKKYIADLPSIQELENLEIAESSTIYDRDGNELYSIFKEKRTYVGYEDISTNMVHAIVAGEDKRFFENPGIDFIGLVRAVIQKVTGQRDSLGGTSTLTQQLIRNTIITNERTAERKIKEMYLAYKLTNDVSKEKILELYLNKISFGSNAYGIEQAAKTFFNKSAKNLSILEASILASLPKGPTYYSPYNNYDRLMGYPYTYLVEENENITQLLTPESISNNQSSINQLIDFISNLKLKRFSDSKAILCGLEKDKVKAYISVDSDGCSVIDYSELLSFLNGIKIQIDDSNILEYQTGRKDFILGRMLEDEYITFDEYKKSLLDSFGYSFNQYKESIKYPHFVFFIREYLEEKYGKEVIEKGGFKIYTTIDSDIQDKAEEIISKYTETNQTKFGASNAALISIDNETGEILAMVGGKDYFDQENKGNVNIITSRLQPGSTFKPFVYSMAVDKEVIGTKTPVYDVKTTFPGGYIPNNFDGKFMGKMTITEALNYSRNIPAVKMFYLAGGENAIISFMEKLGVTTLSNFKQEYLENYGKEYSYGASMSLGTGLMTPLELASAYSVYANMGYKKEIVPILKILDNKGNVVEEFISENNKGEQVMDASTAFITNYMLSDTSTRPEFWNSFLSLQGRPVAAKTGTSTKQYTENGKEYIFPRNLWTIGYTPQVTTVVWVGNTDGKELKYSGNGLEGAGPIWRDIMNYIHSDKAVKNWSKPGGVKEVPISKISGYLVPDGYNSNLIVSSLFKNIPNKYDTNLQTVEVDMLCNGTVSDTTPQAAIKQVTLLAFHSLKPENSNWEIPVQEWVKRGEFGDESLLNIPNMVPYVNPEICERPDVISSIELGSSTKDGNSLVTGSNYMEIAYRGSNPVKEVEIYIGDTKIKAISTENKLEGVFSGEVFIPKGYTGRQNLKIRAIDIYYFYKDINIEVLVEGVDQDAPEITITNPSDRSIKLYKGDFFNLKGNVYDAGLIRSINIYINGESEKVGITGRDFNYPIGSLNLEEGIHTITVEAVDSSLKSSKVDINLEILPTP